MENAEARNASCIPRSKITEHGKGKAACGIILGTREEWDSSTKSRYSMPLNHKNDTFRFAF